MDDLWKIREVIHQIDPSYKFYFGHHTPVQWESVFMQFNRRQYKHSYVANSNISSSPK